MRFFAPVNCSFYKKRVDTNKNKGGLISLVFDRLKKS